MKAPTSALAALVASYMIPTHFVSAAFPPNLETPVFYLLGTDPTAAGDNFLPLRLTGSTRNQATFSGSGPIAKFYFLDTANNSFIAMDDSQGASNALYYHPYVDFRIPNSSECAQSGPMGFSPENSTIADPCVSYTNFTMGADGMRQLLGSKLVWGDNSTDFYSCGDNREIYFKTSISNAPTECSISVQLYSLPVVDSE